MITERMITERMIQLAGVDQTDNRIQEGTTIENAVLDGIRSRLKSTFAKGQKGITMDDSGRIHGVGMIKFNPGKVTVVIPGEKDRVFNLPKNNIGQVISKIVQYIVHTVFVYEIAAVLSNTRFRGEEVFIQYNGGIYYGKIKPQKCCYRYYCWKSKNVPC